MRKIGTISSAIGFIFLGIWMIVYQTNVQFAAEVFKWWPVIIIILGCEILLGFNRKEDYQRIRLNGLIIPVILIFIAVNIFIEGKVKIGEGITWFKKSGNIDTVIDKLSDFDYTNYKAIESRKEINTEGKEFTFDTDNGDITVKNSTNGKITISATVYLKENVSQDKYDIIETREANGYKVVIDESYIKKVKAVLYVPDNVNVVLKGDNSKIVSDENRIESNFDIDINNASIDIKSTSGVKAKINNAKIDIKDTQNVEIHSTNGTINLDGKVPEINVDITNGVVNVDNEVCEDVNIKASSGTVKVDTNDENVDVKLELNHGTSKINDDRRINSGQSKLLGDGSGKVKIDVNNGLINFNN